MILLVYTRKNLFRRSTRNPTPNYHLQEARKRSHVYYRNMNRTFKTQYKEQGLETALRKTEKNFRMDMDRPLQGRLVNKTQIHGLFNDICLV